VIDTACEFTVNGPAGPFFVAPPPALSIRGVCPGIKKNAGGGESGE